jgi:hypothetical protein
MKTKSQPRSNLKLSAAQIAMLRNELAPAGSEGRSFVSNISTGNALITKGMAERVKGRYSANTIVITAAGCEAIGLDYNDVISAQLKKAAKREMIAYVAEESVVATEAELIAWAGWEADPQYLIDAYIAAGGEMIVEETPVIEETSALSPYIACACGQLLAPKEGPMCPTCKANGGKPRNRQLIMGRDGYPIATEEAAIEDGLPAKMPLPAIVDADTMPVMDVVTVDVAPLSAEASRILIEIAQAGGKMRAGICSRAVTEEINASGIARKCVGGVDGLGQFWEITSLGWQIYNAMKTPTVTPTYAIDDHVTFNYFRDPNYKDEVYQGRIMERAFDRLSGWMYRIDPAPCAFHLSPRWISERYVRTTLTGEMVATIVANDHVSALYDAMTMAEQVYMDYARLDTFDMPADHATFKRKVAAHITYLRAKQAYTGVRSDAMITYLYGAQNAPQTPHNGPSAVVDDVQAFSSNLDQRKPEIAAEPFAPVNATNDHPLALIQPGSEASKTDWDAQQAKRDAQHAEAKARVEALNGVYQAPVRKGIQMHSPEYLNQIFKQASGGAK